MRRIVFLTVFAFALALAFVGLGGASQAGDPSFADRFAADHKVKGESGVYKFDKSHSFIGFKVKHMGLIEVPGYFRDFVGEVNFNAEDVTKSSVTFTAQATSVDTGVPNRDNHLRQPDFFDVAKFPELQLPEEQAVIFVFE